MREVFINKGYFNIHYYEWGDQGNPTIVCFHGLCNSGASFFELAKYLENEYHVLSFDSPGHGKTSPLQKEEEYLFSNLANWYENVLQEVVNEPFYILGHSWGADLALHFAKQYPGKGKGVILLDGGYTFPDFQEDMTFENVYDGWNDYMDNLSVFNTWEDVEKEYQSYTKRWNESIEEMVVTMFKEKGNFELLTSKFTVLSIIKAFFKEGFPSTYPYIKSPLLLIHATEPEELSSARVKGISELNRQVDDVTIVSMKETGHMVHWDHPDVVGDEIKQWIDRKDSLSI